MRQTIGFTILLVLAAALCGALLELGLHVIWGWLLAALAFAAFAVIHSRFLRGKKRLVRFCGWVLFCGVLGVVLYASRPPVRAVPAVEGKDPEVTDVVSVAQGQLTGVFTEDGAVEVYAGIPYAAPPVGALRWKAPEEPEPWEGVRACDHFAPMSMQNRSGTVFDSLTHIAVYHDFKPSLKDNWRPPMSEDSLYLNVWKPAGDITGAPVLVFIHGGSLSTGQTWYSEYNGEEFARRGIVVVNMAYRLNVFGYFAEDSLLAEDGTTGNYGLLDQIQALRWVQENIAAFGGDPAQVTICGESAGASSVNALCVSPLSGGLFRYAIAESSGITAVKPYHTFRALEDALAAGRETLAQFHAENAEELRQLPAETLLSARQDNSAMTVDGYAIAEQPYLTYEKGENHEAALLSGFNVHEADLFTLFNRVTEQNYVEILSEVYEDDAEEVAALYPARPVDPDYRYVVEMGGSAKGAFNQALSAAWFAYSHYNWSRLLTAQGKPVYEYYFTKDNGMLGSNHAGELPYVFGALRAHDWLYDETDAALSETIMDYWENFIRTGDPNGSDLPGWPQFREAPEQVMELGDSVGMVKDPHLAVYEVIDRYQAAFRK